MVGGLTTNKGIYGFHLCSGKAVVAYLFLFLGQPPSFAPCFQSFSLGVSVSILEARNSHFLYSTPGRSETFFQKSLLEKRLSLSASLLSTKKFSILYSRVEFESRIYDYLSFSRFTTDMLKVQIWPSTYLILYVVGKISTKWKYPGKRESSHCKS